MRLLRLVVQRFASLSLVLSVMVSVCSGTAAFGRFDIVVQSGDLAPNGNGEFSVFSIPVINENGDLAFGALLTGTNGGTVDDVGIFRGDGTSLTQIAREGQVAPDGNGVFSGLSFAAADGPRLNNSGQVAFKAELAGTTGGTLDDTGIFRGAGGNITQVAREGDNLPVGSGEYAGFGGIDFNDAGQVAYQVELRGTFGGTNQDSAVYRDSLGIAYESGSLFSYPYGEFDSFDFPALNNSGEMAFYAEVRDQEPLACGGAGFCAGIFISTDNSADADVTAIVLPLVNEFTIGAEVFGDVGTSFALNEHGQVVFAAEIWFLDKAGIFRGDRNGIIEIAREGDIAPDENGALGPGPFYPSAINNAGQVAFSADLTGTAGGSTDSAGIFLGQGGDLTQIARTGQTAPGANGLILYLGFPALNDAGHVAFESTFDDGSVGIIISDGVELVQIARSGMNFDGSTVTNLALIGGSATEPKEGLNNAAQVAVNLHLQDGRTVLARFTPELHWRTAGSGQWSNDNNWTLGIQPNSALYDTFIDSDQSLTVTGPSTNRVVRSLILGGSGPAVSTLRLDGSVSGDIVAANTSRITAAGELVLSSGRAVTAPSIMNEGVIRGTGTLGADLMNLDGGLIRIDSGQSLTISGSLHINQGNIEVNGGEIRFIGPLSNTGSTARIISRDATVRLDAGLVNEATVLLASGESHVYGDISNSGTIIVAAGSSALFYDDVETISAMNFAEGAVGIFFGQLSGAGVAGEGTVFLEGNVQPGLSPGTMSFGGEVSIGPNAVLEIGLSGPAPGTKYDRVTVSNSLDLSGKLKVTLVDGFTPSAGQSFDILDWGNMSGTFTSTSLPKLAGLTWDISQLYISGVLTVVAELVGDYNQNGIIDAADYSAWRDAVTAGSSLLVNDPTPGTVDESDFTYWRAHFGETLGSGAGAGQAAVPEPSSVVLLILAAAGWCLRRGRAG